MKQLLLLGLLTAACPMTLADLKPDIIECDGKKAARNAAMEATVGVSGNCDAKKMADDAKDDAADKVSDRVDNTKDHLGHTVDNVKDNTSDALDRDKKHKHNSLRE
ncbi:hypothetical protein [Gilvimarinus agarilyticus]|uniref:hypothetical protein n=1 Tax=Gilvimarinus agarilyticus TaxID=679259 RepID=UPI0005A0C79F|nr:hypothetical protein [Gilvimarinus agarilyticus]